MINFNELDPGLAYEIGELEQAARLEERDKFRSLLESALTNPEVNFGMIPSDMLVRVLLAVMSVDDKEEA